VARSAGSSRQWDGELPRYISFAEPVQPGGGFQRGYIYEKAIDNLGVELDNPPQAEYRVRGRYDPRRTDILIDKSAKLR
jgi:hypothetical protein